MFILIGFGYVILYCFIAFVLFHIIRRSVSTNYIVNHDYDRYRDSSVDDQLKRTVWYWIGYFIPYDSDFKQTDDVSFEVGLYTVFWPILPAIMIVYSTMRPITRYMRSFSDADNIKRKAQLALTKREERKRNKESRKTLITNEIEKMRLEDSEGKDVWLFPYKEYKKRVMHKLKNEGKL